MRTYLLLRERGKSFRADPRVQEALRVSGVSELAIPTLGSDESWRDLPPAENFDPDALSARGYGYARLGQLAIDHLTGQD